MPPKASAQIESLYERADVFSGPLFGRIRARARPPEPVRRTHARDERRAVPLRRDGGSDARAGDPMLGTLHFRRARATAPRRRPSGPPPRCARPAEARIR
ncbi:hypothetical protein DO73_3794 [Burkholderia pseudomallei]|nr:hypothetical protein DO73_3794 [Burkholderia pseudomallei]